jgi:hypothetical protein
MNYQYSRGHLVVRSVGTTGGIRTGTQEWSFSYACPRIPLSRFLAAFRLHPDVLTLATLRSNERRFRFRFRFRFIVQEFMENHADRKALGARAESWLIPNDLKLRQ